MKSGIIGQRKESGRGKWRLRIRVHLDKNVFGPDRSAQIDHVRSTVRGSSRTEPSSSPPWTSSMTETLTFKRLERTISLIARHPFYPGKGEVVHECLDDLEERYREGLLTDEQKSILVSILTTDEPDLLAES